jgi:hypothetical protein
MRAAAFPRAIFALALTASLASADQLDQAALTRAADAIARTLALVAADKGAPAALKLSGEERLPQELSELLDAIASAPRAGDLRLAGDELELKASLLDAVIADVTVGEGAQLRPGSLALTRFRESVAAGLLDELSWLEARQRGVSLDVESFLHDFERVPSLKVVRERKRGPRLIHLASQAALLEHRLATSTSWGRLEVGLRLFDREAKPESLLLLRLLTRLALRPELDAVSSGDAIRKTLEAVQDNLAQRREVLLRAIRDNREACRKTRTRELRSVVAGRRGAPMAEAVPLVKAFRRAFQGLPDLEATPTWNVYRDRNDARLHFWLPVEGRWVRGPKRVDPLEPIVSALLESEDPGLRLLATRSHALAQIYTLFLDPFSAARAALDESSLGLFAWVAKARKIAGPKLRSPLETALAERLGVPVELFGTAARSGRARRQVLDHVLRIGLAQGPAAARALRESLAKARVRVEKIRLRRVQVGIKGLPAEVPVDLCWSPPPRFPRRDDETWLVAPPFEVRPGTLARGVALGRAPLAVEAFAYDASILRATGRPSPGQTLTLTLAPGAPGIALARLGPGALRAWSVPREAPGLELFARGPSRAERPLDAGERLALTPRDVSGTWTVEGRSARGEVQAQASLKLAGPTGVVVTSGWPAEPGAKVEAEVRSGGEALSEARTWRLLDGAGVVVETQKGPRFSWKAGAPGRYLLSASPGLSPGHPLPLTPVAVATSSGVVRVGLRPWGQRATLAPGQPAFVRLDTWPAVLAEEVLEVRWTLRRGEEILREVRTRSQPGQPATALRLPIRIREDAAPGKRSVSAEIVTSRRTLSVAGSFQVLAGGRSVPLETRDEPLLRLPRPGQRLSPVRVRASEASAQVRWHLVSPGGVVRELSARADRGVDVALQSDDLEGPYELWFHGLASDKTPVFGWLALRGVAVAELPLSAPRGAAIGEQIQLEARPPRGFVGPYQVRFEGKSWQKGTSLKWEVKGANHVVAELLDAQGHLAQGTLDFEAAARETSRGPRVGIVANTLLKRIFLVDEARIGLAISSGKLPRGWVVIEQGPLSIPIARKELWAKFPYDGPATKSQVAYRSQRFWKKLSQGARKALGAAGVAAETPFDVMITPLAEGHETLPDQVGRLLGTSGGWTYRLSGVSLEAAGIKREEGALEWSETSNRGGSLKRIEVAGPLADLVLAQVAPSELSLDASNRLVFSVSGLRKSAEGLPAPFSAFAPEALVCPSLEVQVSFDPPAGDPLRVSIQRPGRDASAAGVTLWFEHLSTTRDESLAGSPRKGERHRLHLLTHGGKGVQAEVLERALHPGTLANEPRKLVIKLQARLRRALPSAKWPAGQPRPKAVRIGGVPFLFDPSQIDDAPGEARLSVTFTYERRAPGSSGAKSAPAEALGEVAVGEVKPLEGDPKTLRASLAQALATSKGKGAERAAWTALQLEPEVPESWALVADLALGKEQLPLARVRAEQALAQGAQGDAAARAHLVLGRVALGIGDFEAAAESLRAGQAAAPKDAGLVRRLKALAKDL